MAGSPLTREGGDDGDPRADGRPGAGSAPGAGRVPAGGGAVRAAIAPLRPRRRDPGRAPGLQVEARPAAVDRAGARPGVVCDGRNDGLALRDHATRPLRPAHVQLSERRGRAHLPLGRWVPHRGAVLHRRLGHLLLPHPRRRRAGRSRRGRDHPGADGGAPSGTNPKAVRGAHPPAPIRALHGGPQHLVRQRPGIAARDPGRRHRPDAARHPLLLRPERLLRV